MRLIACALIAATLLAGCENKGLRQVTARGDGPDEFLIVPVNPLEYPKNLSVLPAPTPDGINRSDTRPLENAVAALGGKRPSENGSVPNRDAALVKHTSRFGADPNIRKTLAQIDADFRQRESRLAQIRLIATDRYLQAYRSQALDAESTAEAFQRVGIPTPNAPTGNR